MASKNFLLGLIGLLLVGCAQCCENGTEFECNDGTCISAEYLCDGKYLDCPGGEDEGSACPCDVGYFQCNDGECIYEEWVCDGEADCAGGEDEPDTCPPCFHCQDDPSCLPGSWVCDGYDDCPGGEDEANCKVNSRKFLSETRHKNLVREHKRTHKKPVITRL